MLFLHKPAGMLQQEDINQTEATVLVHSLALERMNTWIRDESSGASEEGYAPKMGPSARS
jgi:hypothetical protein